MVTGLGQGAFLFAQALGLLIQLGFGLVDSTGQGVKGFGLGLCGFVGGRHFAV